MRVFNLLFIAVALSGHSQEVRIEVDAGRIVHPLSRYLTGACIEDVNHEVYGGIDSQMIFGESFQEPPPPPALKDFNAYGGSWIPDNAGALQAAGGDGPKLVSDTPPFAEGEVSVDLLFPDAKPGNAGLILNVSQPGKGADKFNGYEVALEPAGNLVLGRHRQNWEEIRKVHCDMRINQWITLGVRLSNHSLDVFVDGRHVTSFLDSDHPLEAGTIGLRTWQREARFRNLSIRNGSAVRRLAFELNDPNSLRREVSGMWRACQGGSAAGKFSLEKSHVFVGAQSQRVTFENGTGELGLENQGLNRRGMNFIKGKPYEGHLWVRSDKPAELFVALESRDGSSLYAEKRLEITSHGWQRIDYQLTPKLTDTHGRFAVKLRQPGSVSLGYVFLQPGRWHRFQGLPVRKDVAQGLIDQGITVLRQGGSMVNAAEYRWKKMIGPRAFRPPYRGTWYPYASNGWGIFEFLTFCERAGIVAIPDVNIDETPQDMADFVEYANGHRDRPWGKRRAADGHAKPFHLKYLELGNEERVDEKYWQKFKLIATAIWANDPDIILVVGDFLYGQPISDPFHFTGNPSGLTSLEAHQKILALAKEHNREVWFDVHVDTEGPRPGSSLAGMFSFYDALNGIAGGARFRVAVFELNAGNHSQRRALANALAIGAIEQDGRLLVTTSANCLQPDGQNDNDWDQGLLFLNPSQVWLQPPGYVTRMISRSYQPQLVRAEVQGSVDNLQVIAKRSENKNTLVLEIVNVSDRPIAAAIQVNQFKPTHELAQIEELAGTLGAQNTAAEPFQIHPMVKQWRHNLERGAGTYQFPPTSFTVITLK